jgi:hypothetical protein
MTSFNQIGPWITLGVLCVIVIFLCFFYIAKAIQSIKKPVNKNPVANVGDTTISIENKKKLKEEILHDIVSDITPVLKKRIEKAF